MTARHALRIAVITLYLAAAVVSSKESVPISYEDDYVTVRAGLPDAGTSAVHLGDSLSLIIDITFDSRQVQIESLDDDVFQRAFSAMPSIRLYSPAIVTTHEETGDRVRVTGNWRFQVLACPDDLTRCPGSRSYELPVMTLGYQLINDTGSTADGRSARFRPWPGKIDIAPAIPVIPESDATLIDVLPGGAYDSPQPVAELAPTRSMLIAAGALLLLAGFLASERERRPQVSAARAHDSNSRWEQALARLQEDTMPDDEWSDLLRRCLAWYCVDELGQNPYAWLGEATNAIDAPAAAREFFLDVLQQKSISSGRRAGYLDRLYSATAEQQV